MNHASAGLLPRATRAAVGSFVDAQAARGRAGLNPFEAELDAHRAQIGAFIGASAGEIALLRSTADGANVIALGLDWKAGDEIVLSDDEFGSNAYPWLALRRHGVRVRFVRTAQRRLTPAVLREMVSPRTRLVAVSWVGFSDGYRHDLAGLAEVAHAAGALVAVDGIQGLGAFPLDVREVDCDALYSGAYKWLLGLQGVSFLYVRPALIEKLALAMPGWRSVSDIWDDLNYDQPPAPNASRFDGGTPNFAGVLSLATSIGVLRAAGLQAIAGQILALTDRLVDGLRSQGAEVASVRDGERRSGIVTFSLPGLDAAALGVRLQAGGFAITHRAAGLRVSPHGHNSAQEIDAFLQALAENAAAMRR